MNECTMGFAFKALFEFIENNINGGTASYDGFFLFNADNIVKKDYFTKDTKGAKEVPFRIWG